MEQTSTMEYARELRAEAARHDGGMPESALNTWCNQRGLMGNRRNVVITASGLGCVNDTGVYVVALPLRAPPEDQREQQMREATAFVAAALAGGRRLPVGELAFPHMRYPLAPLNDVLLAVNAARVQTGDAEYYQIRRVFT